MTLESISRYRYLTVYQSKISSGFFMPAVLQKAIIFVRKCTVQKQTRATNKSQYDWEHLLWVHKTATEQ